jgi:hypothetical protein
MAARSSVFPSPARYNAYAWHEYVLFAEQLNPCTDAGAAVRFPVWDRAGVGSAHRHRQSSLGCGGNPMAHGVCAGLVVAAKMQQINAGVCQIGGDFDICAGGHLLVFIRLLSRAAEKKSLRVSYVKSVCTENINLTINFILTTTGMSLITKIHSYSYTTVKPIIILI